MSVDFFKLTRLGYARLAALLQGMPSSARREAFDRAFPGTLGAACFGDAACWPHLADAAPDLPLAFGRMARLVPASAFEPADERTDERDEEPHGEACFEIWQCAAADLASGREGPVRYRFSQSAGVVFGSALVLEAQVGIEQAPGATPLERAAYAAYEAMFRVLDRLDLRHPLRIWNVVPAMNAEQFGSERYRQFNSGRQRAFEACGRPVVGSVPAASALGAPARIVGDAAPAMPLVVSFLATRSASHAIENPRQVSAYRYPAAYGPSAPTFARAAAWHDARWPGAAPMLFVSGTASIVGHETVHRGDVTAQLRETLVNIDTVLGEAARKGHGHFALRDLIYRVYVRDPHDAAMLAAIDRTLHEQCGSPVRVLYLHADICRADLLLEVEASAGHGAQVLI
jgi:chorismate lyase / 3-hydroxybenzoate synthase